MVDDKGTKRYPRDPQVARNALIQCKYKCTYDDTHFSFIARGSKHMYVEAHHLIPLSASEHFVKSIDVEANVVALCSTCHDCIHHGTDSDRYNLIKKLYNDRKERLAKAEIYVSLEQLLSYYGISME